MVETEPETEVVPLFEVDPNKDVSYINLTLLDASKTIEATVQEKLQEKSAKIRFPMVRKILAKEKVQKKIASVAGKKVKPSLIANQLSEQLPKILMYMIDKKVGMKVAARTVFREDAYIVIEFQVKYVDTAKFYAKIKEGPPSTEDEDVEVDPEEVDAWMKEQEALAIETETETATEAEAKDSNTEGTKSWTQWLAQPLNYATAYVSDTIESVTEKVESETLPSVVQSKITEQMGAIMEKKLAEKLLEAEIAVLPGESQARYFYANLEAVKERNSKD